MINNITLSSVNTYTLQKQHLTEKSEIDDIIQIAKDIGGLHATGSTTPYFSLFARTNHFTRSQLDEELYLKKNLGKIRYVRKTVYILPKELLGVAYTALKPIVELASERYSEYMGINRQQYVTMSKSILELLEQGGMSTTEIKKTLNTTLNISPIVNLMCDQGLLIRGKPKAGWKSNIHTYYLFQDFFPNLDLKAFDMDDARKILVHQYLASFAPVTENDTAWWTGFPKRDVRKIIDSLQDSLQYLQISDLESEYLIRSSEEHSLKTIKSPDTLEMSLLPGLDPYMMGYKNRDRYLDPKNYEFVYDRGGNATSTIMINGKVAGVWDFVETPAPLVKIFLFEEVEDAIYQKIVVKAQHLGRFITGKDVQIRKYDSMIPLTKRTAGSSMSPLKDI
jgi:hypothetical protein